MDLLRQALSTGAGRIGLALVSIAALTLIVAAVVQAIGTVPSFWEGWWWAVHHLVDPGALGDDETWAARLLGLVVTLSGIVIFLGVILAVLTEVVSRSLQALESAPVPAHGRDHVVFVGWSERLPQVIAPLQPRAW